MQLISRYFCWWISNYSQIWI